MHIHTGLLINLSCLNKVIDGLTNFRSIYNHIKFQFSPQVTALTRLEVMHVVGKCVHLVRRATTQAYGATAQDTAALAVSID